MHRGRQHKALVEKLGDGPSRRPSHSILRSAWSPTTPFRYLNSMNRLVRTRMPGGVAGVSGDFPEPLCRFGNRHHKELPPRGFHCRHPGENRGPAPARNITRTPNESQQGVVKVSPIGVGFLDQSELPDSFPFFDRLLSTDG